MKMCAVPEQRGNYHHGYKQSDYDPTFSSRILSNNRGIMGTASRLRYSARDSGCGSGASLTF